MGALTSMNIFLRQEIDRMQRVITAVRNTLVDLKLAIDGTIIMSENLKDALDNIYDARVPALWKKVFFTHMEKNTQLVIDSSNQRTLKKLCTWKVFSQNNVKKRNDRTTATNQPFFSPCDSRGNPCAKCFLVDNNKQKQNQQQQQHAKETNPVMHASKTTTKDCLCSAYVPWKLVTLKYLLSLS